MPFQSEKQRRYMWVHHPEIARDWSHKYGSKPVNSGDHKAAAGRRLKKMNESSKK